jgi:hypothetical protein
MKSFSATIILESYFQKSVGIFEAFDEMRPDLNDKLCETYVALARFCDGNYRHFVEYMASKEFEDKQLLMEQIQKDAADM